MATLVVPAAPLTGLKCQHLLTRHTRGRDWTRGQPVTQRVRILTALGEVGEASVAELADLLPGIPRDSLSAQLRILAGKGRVRRVETGRYELLTSPPSARPRSEPRSREIWRWMRTIESCGQMAAWRLPDLLWEDLEHFGYIRTFATPRDGERHCELTPLGRAKLREAGE